MRIRYQLPVYLHVAYCSSAIIVVEKYKITISEDYN